MVCLWRISCVYDGEKPGKIAAPTRDLTPQAWHDFSKVTNLSMNSYTSSPPFVVRWMGATIPEENALVINLAAPFGWSGSPSYYGAFGRAITTLVSSNSPASVAGSDDDEPFFRFEWADDHVLVEPDHVVLNSQKLPYDSVCSLCWGPPALMTKFSEWVTELQVLGLIWNTMELTVSMPREKVNKCLDRVLVLHASTTVTKTQLQKLLGSLRHLTSCLRLAIQSLHAACSRLKSFPTTPLHVSEASRRDLTPLVDATSSPQSLEVENPCKSDPIRLSSHRGDTASSPRYPEVADTCKSDPIRFDAGLLAAHAFTTTLGVVAACTGSEAAALVAVCAGSPHASPDACATLQGRRQRHSSLSVLVVRMHPQMHAPRCQGNRLL
ncbi:unnamed protein product [Phytophthora lilii]|uniref:Unnamed protein product n=1 Tax=Phytophthora lilii TaxID=2077276 RepID=A0A9W7CPG9_9STRA|nr:unnamed protein product [Phytophthora lilii]